MIVESETGEVGPSLRSRRQAAGLTQRELADRAGMSVRAVRYLESGRTRAPRSASLRQLEQALDAAVEPAAPAATVIGVLGPLSLRVGGEPVEVGGAKIAALLGLLALQPHSTVSRDEIVDVLWGEQPPASHAHLVHTYVGRLRRLLGPAPGPRLIAGTRGGYLLTANEDQLDLLKFAALSDRAAEAAAAGDRERAGSLYDQSLACWRGSLLAGVDQRLRQHPAAVALAARRVSLSLAYADIALARGEYAEVAARLRPLLADETLHEGLQARMMLALAGSGQQVAALGRFDELRSALKQELGVEPGRELREAHLKVLRGQVSARPPGERNCLPRDLPDFTGRYGECRELLGAPPAGVVTAIDGMAGVGKTTLAVHLAHELAPHYPDGQLFLDLRAHSAGQEPVSARDALESLLRQFGVEGERIPKSVNDCASLWRSLAAERRLLVVLDNVADAAQLRPLLPNGRWSWTVVTSRGRLPSLEGVHRLSLDVLPHDEAAELFAQVLGRPVTGEADAVAEVLRLCGFLPLAVRIAGAKARAHPSWTVAHLAGRLRDEHRRLAELRVGDRSVEAAFALSYDLLGAPEQRMFRLLGECPGTGFDAYAAAALAGLPLAEAEDLLDQLLDAHLLLEPVPGRFRFHDLLLQHARKAARRDEDDNARQQAQDRVTGYYLHAAAQAADLLEPTRRRWDPGVGPVDLPRFAGQPEAVGWLTLEHENLVAVIAAASARDSWAHCWQLAQCLWRFFFVRGHLQDWIHTHRLALAATLRHGDVLARAETHKNLGLAHWRRADFTEALEHHHRALELDEEAGDVWGQAKTHNHLGFIHARMGRHIEAVHHQRQAVTLYHQTADDCGRARAQLGLGIAYYHAGDIETACYWLDLALALTRQAEDHWGQGLALIGYGFALEEKGRPLLEQALGLTHAIGDRWSECLALTGLGICDHLAGATGPALDRLGQAVTIARESGDRWGLRLALSALGRVLSDRTRYAEAVAAHQEALVLTRELCNKHLEAEVLADLAAALAPSA